jgi:hypothetical protein
MPIVGAEVGDQSKLRPMKPLHSIDEFLAFLAQLEAVFGVIERPRVITKGDRFRL